MKQSKAKDSQDAKSITSNSNNENWTDLKPVKIASTGEEFGFPSVWID